MTSSFSEPELSRLCHAYVTFTDTQLTRTNKLPYVSCAYTRGRTRRCGGADKEDRLELDSPSGICRRTGALPALRSNSDRYTILKQTTAVPS